MILDVLPMNIPCFFANIRAAMLRRFRQFLGHKWEEKVKDILLAESQRGDSPIRIRVIGELSAFVLNVKAKDWLSTHHDYIPLDHVASQVKKAQSSETATPSENDTSFLQYRAILSYYKRSKLESQIPPGMSSYRAHFVDCRIFDMLNDETRNIYVETLLELSESEGRRFAQELWSMLLYRESLRDPVFKIFCELAATSDKWATIVSEIIFCLEPRDQDENAPFNYIVNAAIEIPPNTKICRISGFLFLLDYMKETPEKWSTVIEWLFKNQKNRFKVMFVNLLQGLGFHNEHLRYDIRRIFRRLLHSKSWSKTIVTGITCEED